MEGCSSKVDVIGARFSVWGEKFSGFMVLTTSLVAVQAHALRAMVVPAQIHHGNETRGGLTAEMRSEPAKT